MIRPDHDDFVDAQEILNRVELVIDALQCLLDAMWDTYGPALQQQERENRRHTTPIPTPDPDNDLPF